MLPVNRFISSVLEAFTFASLFALRGNCIIAPDIIFGHCLREERSETCGSLLSLGLHSIKYSPAGPIKEALHTSNPLLVPDSLSSD